MDSDYVIETHGLMRSYQTYKKSEGVLNSFKGFFNRQHEEKVALQPTDLKIAGGQIIGLVGGNGAGKTTLLKLLCGLITPSSGQARVLGYDPAQRQSAYLKQVSILLGQKNQLWWDLPPADSFELLARIYEIDRVDAKKRVLELADILQCRELLQVQLRRLSLGERMKMEIIGSLLHKPRVLFLDEPTIGLDIVAQTNIREFLADYVKREQPTVILTSHYMDDIAKLADRLLLISKGSIVYDGTVQNFMGTAEPMQKLSLTIERGPEFPIEIAPGVILSPDALTFEAELSQKKLPLAIQRIMSHASVLDLKIQEADFEDVIRKFWRKNLGCARVAILSQLEYRFNLFTDAVLQPILTGLIEVALWAGILASTATGTLAGFPRESYLAYALWAAFFARTSSNWMYEAKMTEEIETGTVNAVLARPISFYEYYLGQFMGYKVLTTLVSFVVPFAICLFIAGTTNLARLPLAFALTMYYLVFVHTLSFALASFAFFFNRVYSLTVAKNIALWVLTGELFPLDLFPEPYRRVLIELPFASAVYLPVGYLTGRVEIGAIGHAFVSVTVGTAVIGAFGAFVWNAGRRSYSGTGA